MVEHTELMDKQLLLIVVAVAVAVAVQHLAATNFVEEMAVVALSLFVIRSQLQESFRR
jgi:hypothetical protein